MDSGDLEVGAFFTITNKDIWKLESFCLEPTCTLKDLETGEKRSFGIGGLMAQEFKKVKMPEGE